MVSVSNRCLFCQPMDEKIKTWTLHFLPRKTLIWRRHCSTGQSRCSMTSNRSIDWFLESSSGMKFFRSAEPPINLPKATRVCICSINQSSRSISRSFVVSVLFASFHFEVIRQSLYLPESIQWVTQLFSQRFFNDN